MINATEWARAYAIQAQSDLITHDYLCGHTDLPVCHRLHYMQMACEKLVKAHLSAAGTDLASLQSSHAYTAKTLPIILRQKLVMLGAATQKFRWLVPYTKQLAREIELLAPAVNAAGNRPENAEYPWEDHATDTVRVPARYSFPNLSMIRESSPAQTVMLKLIRAAITELAT